MSTREIDWVDPVPSVNTSDDLGADESPDDPELADDQETIEYEAFADSAMTIPGQGDPGDNCGIYATQQFCDHCGEPDIVKSLCGKRVCPDCYQRWEVERTVGGVQRLAKARYAEDGGIDRRTIHAVVSPPEGEIKTIREWYDAYSDAYELAQEQGIRGGVAIGHGFRVKSDVKVRFRQLEPDCSIWTWIRDELSKSWRSYTYWSPHFHIIGLCRDLDANKPDQQDGWNCVRLSTLAPFKGLSDNHGVSEMIAPKRYVLDHGTFEAGTTKDCVRWFGDLSTTKFQASEHMSEGAINAIDRLVEETVGNPSNSAESGDTASDEESVDECTNCGGTSFSPIWDAGAALADKGWCDRIGREQVHRLETAFEWAIGDIEPPPDLQDPRSEDAARAAFEAML